MSEGIKFYIGNTDPLRRFSDLYAGNTHPGHYSISTGEIDPDSRSIVYAKHDPGSVSDYPPILRLESREWAALCDAVDRARGYTPERAHHEATILREWLDDERRRNDLAVERMTTPPLWTPRP